MEIAAKLLAFIAFSVILNIPFGSYRNLTRKFSIAWWLAIHLPIPIIIIMRTLIFDLNFLWVLPFSLAGAVFGQIAGSRLALFGHQKEVGPAANTVGKLRQTEVGTEVKRS